MITSRFHRGVLHLFGRFKDKYYLDSFFVFTSTLILSGLGLLFWVVTAKLYTDDEVGIATAILSIITLLMSISRFGFDQSIVKYLPIEDKGKVLGTAISVTALLSLIFGSVFLLGIDLWARDLAILKDEPILFLSILLLSGLTTITGMTLIALKKPIHASIANAVSGIRIPLLFFFVISGTIGIILSAAIGFALCLAYGFIVLFLLNIRPKKLDFSFLRRSLSFSASNYIIGLLNSASGLLLPIIILNLLGANETAYFYMAYSIAYIAFMVPNALGTTLFVEGSHGASLEKFIRKSFFGALIILIPVAILSFVAGGPLLGLIGKQYEAGGLALMQLLVISSIPQAYMSTFVSASRARGDNKTLLSVGAFNFLALISLSIIMINLFGIVGVGFAWIVGYLATDCFIIALIRFRLSKR